MSDEQKVDIDPNDLPRCMRVAAQALCSVRSVVKYAKGGTLRPLLALRVEKAAREVGP